MLLAGLAVTLTAATAAVAVPAGVATPPPVFAMPALAAPTVWAAASPPRPARPCANGTLADLVAATPSLSLFARALAAVRYDDDLLPVLADRAATRTVFAPTNGAFMALAGTLGAAGPPGHEDAAWAAVVAALTRLGAGNPTPLLRTILRYHLLAGGALGGGGGRGTVRLAALAGGGAQTTREGGTLSVRADRTVADRAPAGARRHHRLGGCERRQRGRPRRRPGAAADGGGGFAGAPAARVGDAGAAGDGDPRAVPRRQCAQRHRPAAADCQPGGGGDCAAADQRGVGGARRSARLHQLWRL